jgi:cobalt-precorrin 5A hydrolase
LIGITTTALAAHPRPGSDRVRKLYGTGSVAESAALAAAGLKAVLVVTRVTSPDGLAVVAIAEGQGA